VQLAAVRAGNLCDGVWKSFEAILVDKNARRKFTARFRALQHQFAHGLPSMFVGRVFRARFPNGTNFQRAYPDRIFTHAYLVLYECPDSKDGFQRGFCASLDEAVAKVEAEMLWLSRHSHTFIEAFIVEVEDITGKIQNKK
jgi:hypothetical protein